MQIIAKKSLGQNFLNSPAALERMLQAGEVSAADTVLEVGPGQGALTEKLLAQAGKVIAVEKDDRLIPLLQEKFAAEIAGGKLEIVHGDILEFDWKGKGEYKLIANIPYYITGIFLRKFLESNYQPERIVVMVQKEIAERIIARDGKESLLSISVKAYGEPKYVMTVGRGSFSPAPNVDSAILAITSISKKLFAENNISEEDFFKILRAGFAHKRKKLSGNLKGLIKEGELTGIGLDDNIRAEDLTLADWFKLAEK